CLQYKSPPFTF
nr:immunoglobulin light chain junction region [Macaca mulatta]MOX47993.1 immunoglobulin light chain junction region [Macaca mulatta]MOX48047.1 immunoglobulin light chain junction region [Macaca mulatta]MOX48174.1 immunoglobulin light chain junction region [Macaca mulatta]MOX48234.1 immunoglobulin light chain junction region [Macaca mulatta]